MEMPVSERVSTGQEVSTRTLNALRAEQVSPSSFSLSSVEVTGGDAATKRGIDPSSRYKLRATGARYTISPDVTVEGIN